MATADIEADLSKRDCGHTLFSRHHIGQLVGKVVKIDGVVKKFIINSKTISEDDRNSLRDRRVADQKIRHLLIIITDHYNKGDLQAFKTFIDILGETNNVDISEQLLPIYKERVNYVAILRQLSEQKSLVRDLKIEISRLEIILEEKDRDFESLRCENARLVEHYRKVADDQENTFREKKLSLEKQINENKEDLLLIKKEMEELTRKKEDLENEVELKSNVIRERDKQIVEKEREVCEAIEESNRLRLKFDTLQQQHSEAMVEDKEISKKIKILEEELTEKENTIIHIRKNRTMKRDEVEEEIGKMTRVHEKKMDDLSEKFDTLTRAFSEKK